MERHIFQIDNTEQQVISQVGQKIYLEIIQLIYKKLIEIYETPLQIYVVEGCNRITQTYKKPK